jgi:hypothetical protein
MNKFVFLDLDETLIHAEWNNFGKDRVRVDFTLDSRGWDMQTTESYGVKLRPNAHEFLKTLRRLYPNVYMLTAATSEYGHGMNDAFDLGFTSEQIIGRDLWNALYTSTVKPYSFTDEPCYSVLIDNQYPTDTNARDKIGYLKLFGKAHYIKIKDFYGHHKDELTENIINDLVNNIEEGFNLMRN